MTLGPQKVAYVCSPGQPASSDRSPRNCRWGCQAEATYGVQRTSAVGGQGPLGYCQEHMLDIARSKGSRRTLRRVFRIADEPTIEVPNPHDCPLDLVVKRF